MKKLAYWLILPVLLSACAPGVSMTTPTPEVPPVVQLFAPQPGDELLARGEVYLDDSSLSIMESYPIQVNLLINGNLPTPCHHLRVTVTAPDAENRIKVDVFSVTDPALICTQVLEPLEVSIPLGSFSTGHYSVWLNGQLIDEFDA